MKWTTQAPRTQGFYWAHYAPAAHSGDDPEVVFVREALPLGEGHYMAWVLGQECEMELGEFDRWGDEPISQPEET